MATIITNSAVFVRKTSLSLCYYCHTKISSLVGEYHGSASKTRDSLGRSAALGSLRLLSYAARRRIRSGCQGRSAAHSSGAGSGKRATRGIGTREASYASEQRAYGASEQRVFRVSPALARGHAHHRGGGGKLAAHPNAEPVCHSRCPVGSRLRAQLSHVLHTTTRHSPRRRTRRRCWPRWRT